MKASLIALFLLAAAPAVLRGSEPAGATQVANSGPLAAAAWLKDSPAVQIVDVRTRGEFDGGYIAKATRIEWPAENFNTAAVRNLDPSKPVLVYCRSGNRSSKAAAELVKLGFKEVRQLDGGIIAWIRAGLPVVKPEP